MDTIRVPDAGESFTGEEKISIDGELQKLYQKGIDYLYILRLKHMEEVSRSIGINLEELLQQDAQSLQSMSVLETAGHQVIQEKLLLKHPAGFAFNFSGLDVASEEKKDMHTQQEDTGANIDIFFNSEVGEEHVAQPIPESGITSFAGKRPPEGNVPYESSPTRYRQDEDAPSPHSPSYGYGAFFPLEKKEEEEEKGDFTFAFLKSSPEPQEETKETTPAAEETSRINSSSTAHNSFH